MYRIEDMRISLNPKAPKFVSEKERIRIRKCEETIKRMESK
jgi:hypothetical protein